jgi:Transport protein Trs120 or TRAPPC9, TRAPP II complex subunit
MLHAGVTKRIILPVKKIELAKEITDQAIPTPAWKQFLAANHSAVGETMRRALFWYREALIGDLTSRGRIGVHWSCVYLSLSSLNSGGDCFL